MAEAPLAAHNAAGAGQSAAADSLRLYAVAAAQLGLLGSEWMLRATAQAMRLIVNAI